jgi:hypothetical protein
VDITLLTGLGEEERYISGILNRFVSRIQNAYQFALTHRVVLIKASNGRDVDISLGALPIDHPPPPPPHLLEFAPGLCLPCCTAEDLFIMKAFAGRPRDWLDAESIVVRQRQLDHEYILKHLSELCELKEAPDHLEHAKDLLRMRP